MRIIILLAAIAVLSGCGKSFEKPVAEIVSAKNLWLEQVGNRDYTFDFIKECFCGDNGRSISVEVIKGTTTTALYIDSGEPANISEMGTVPDIFRLAFDALKDEKRTLVAQYNSELGYPEIITINNPELIDSRFTLKIVRLEPNEI